MLVNFFKKNIFISITYVLLYAENSGVIKIVRTDLIPKFAIWKPFEVTAKACGILCRRLLINFNKRIVCCRPMYRESTPHCI